MDVLRVTGRIELDLAPHHPQPLSKEVILKAERICRNPVEIPILVANSEIICASWIPRFKNTHHVRYTHTDTDILHGRATPQMQCINNGVQILSWHVVLSWHLCSASHLLGVPSSPQDSRVNPSSHFILQDSVDWTVSPQNSYAEALTPLV